MDMLAHAAPGAVFLLNSPHGPEEIWEHLPKTTQETIIKKKLHSTSSTATRSLVRRGMGSRLNTIMQTCFFAISGVLPADEAIEQIKKSIKKTYASAATLVVNKNFAAVDAAVAEDNITRHFDYTMIFQNIHEPEPERRQNRPDPESKQFRISSHCPGEPTNATGNEHGS